MTQAKERRAAELHPYREVQQLLRSSRRADRSGRLSARRTKPASSAPAGLGISPRPHPREMQGPGLRRFYESRPDRAEQVATGARCARASDARFVLDEKWIGDHRRSDAGPLCRAEEGVGARHSRMIEKPLAATLEQADAMLHLAQVHGGHASDRHVERSNPCHSGRAAVRGATTFIEATVLCHSIRAALNVAVVVDR